MPQVQGLWASPFNNNFITLFFLLSRVLHKERNRASFLKILPVDGLTWWTHGARPALARADLRLC
jgi:hypothetical protein